MADHDIDRISAVKKSAEGRLLAIPGVHGVGLGAKYVGGQRTREPAIMVFLEKKKPAARLLPHEIIPAEIDGVKTDVMEAAPPRLHLDDKRYRPLAGGIPFGSGGSMASGGTLGCIARLNGPVPTLVGITNQHCVGIPPTTAVTLLIAQFDVTQPDVITFKGANTPGTLIVVDWALRTPIGPGPKTELGPLNRAFYATTSNDTLATIAQGVANAVTSIAAGLTASAAGVLVTFSASAGGRFDNNVRVFGPHAFFEFADLRALVEGTEITLSGRASEYCGIFTNWNAGGQVPTHGVYTRVRKGDELADIAKRIVAAIKARRPEINATSAGPKVLIPGVQQVECDVSSDVRIGQPTDCFCSTCCVCCANLIGAVRDARIDLDVALIELQPGLQYQAEIEGIGPIKGTRTYKADDLLGPDPIRVRKRGIATGLTSGVISSVDLVLAEIVGLLAFDRPHYHRQYSRAMTILSDKKFSDRGDSGSAIVNDDNEVVGIMFGGNHEKEAWATPIAQIEAAFDLSVVTAEVKGQVNTVPVLHGHAFAAVEGEPLFVERLREVERELTATPGGRELAAAGRRHAHEVVRLVNHNRRVGAVWRRNGGPELVQTALTMAQSGEKQVPRQINGRPIAECLRKMQEIFARYGSAQLAADLRRYGPRIIDLSKFEYPQLLAALEGAPE